MKFSTVFKFIILFVCISSAAYGQVILQKNISLNVNKQRLDNVLEILSNKGNFYFSYNSNIIDKDSLVSYSANNKTVKQILDVLFSDHFEFKESGNYIIIRRAPIKLTLVTSKAATEDKFYVISGYVLNDETGEKI